MDPERQKYRSLRDIYAQLDREAAEAAARVQNPNQNQEDTDEDVQTPNQNPEDANEEVQIPNQNQECADGDLQTPNQNQEDANAGFQIPNQNQEDAEADVQNQELVEVQNQGLLQQNITSSWFSKKSQVENIQEFMEVQNQDDQDELIGNLNDIHGLVKVQNQGKEGEIEDAWQFFDRSDGHLTVDELEKRGYLSLFELIITDEDCIHARLQIPHGLGIDHFNFTTHLLGGVSTAEILVRDRSSKEWGMSVLKIKEDIYFTRGWSGFADWHNLEGGDRLRCFKQDNSHFCLIHTEFEVETIRIGGMPQSFLDANLLWKKTFNVDDKEFEHICIPGIDLKLFFTDQSIVSSAKFKAIRFKVTDETNREWCLKLVPLPEYDDVYGLNSDFVSFCSAVKLSVGDEISFYKPTTPTHSRHFLFRIAKRN